MKKGVLAAGVGALVLSVVLLGVGLWEAFVGVRGKIISVELPGFHELALEEPGLYAGVVQKSATAPLPAAALSRMSIKVMNRDYQEVPVVMNTTGQTFQRLGQQGMLLFNFAVREPGSYTLSGLYLDEKPGPTVPVFVFAQQVQNVKPTLIVTLFFFVFLLGLGIFLLRNAKKW